MSHSRRRYVLGLAALLALAAVLVATELAFVGVRHFWGRHPFTTNLISGLVTILVGVLIVNRLLQRADSMKRREVRWEVYTPFRDHLNDALRDAEDLLYRYGIVGDGSDHAEEQAELLDSNPKWIREVTPLVASISRDLTELSGTYMGPMLGDPDLLDFAIRYAIVQRRMRHLHRDLSDPGTDAQSGRNLLWAVDAMREAAAVHVPQPPELNHDRRVAQHDQQAPTLRRWEPQSEGKGTLWTPRDKKTYRLETWNTISGSPFHSEAMRLLGLRTGSIFILTCFAIEKDGTLTGSDRDFAEFGAIICELDDRLRMAASWNLP